VSCTLRDVAQLSGVSTATVSRVINRAGNVSSKTRSKVLSAISRLKYSESENGPRFIHAIAWNFSKREADVANASQDPGDEKRSNW
jgi:hypothetical protein